MDAGSPWQPSSAEDEEETLQGWTPEALQDEIANLATEIMKLKQNHPQVSGVSGHFH